jgi:hypothetical protein
MFRRGWQEAIEACIKQTSFSRLLLSRRAGVTAMEKEVNREQKTLTTAKFEFFFLLLGNKCG